MNNSIIEISKKKAKAGRTPVKLILHKLPQDANESNKNGIHWVKEYCEDNIDTIAGMQLVAQFLDDKHEVPFGSHGNMVLEENKVIFEDSLVVGSFEKGYVAEGIEVNGETIDAVVGEGYIYNQRFPKLVEFLQEQYDGQTPVEGSVEICASASKGNTKIIYDGGYKEVGRKPQIFDYSGHALVIGEVPADCSAVLMELNSYKKKEETLKKIKDGVSIETNKLSYDDLSTLITRAINIAMGRGYYEYYIHRFYPDTGEIVFKRWEDVGVYYMTTYQIDKTAVVLSDIMQVEEDWKAVSQTEPVEVNATKIKEYLQKEGGSSQMNVEELNNKISELSGQITELNTKITGFETEIVEKNSKIAELEGTLVEANKSLEETKAKFTEVETEVNAYREKEQKAAEDQKKVEINAYFDNEIPKNHFEEAEVNTLKEFVEKCDLEGLKNAEKDLVFKRFKEGKLSIETNTKEEKNDLFFHVKEPKLNDVEAGKALFN